MNKSLTTIVVCAGILLFGMQFAIGKQKPSQPLPLDDIRIFTEVFAKIKSSYVDHVEDEELLKNAIRGMLNGLDPHSTYLNEDAYRTLQEGTSGKFGGLGIEVSMENHFIKVITPIDDTPAQRAGILAGDLIIRLNDTPVKGLALEEAVRIMRGKPGSEIKLTITRQDQIKPIIITVTRDIINVTSVKRKTLEPGFGYIRISNFQENTVSSLHQELDTLKNENNNALEGIVLDLRNNPGGILPSAVGVADSFLDKGLIVYTEGRIKESQLTFNAKPTTKLNNIPMIVIVNGGSASAAEIVAGALQDQKRALIIGEKTFGKGSVQTILPLNKSSAVKMTTARYYTPSGRSIQATGITPDITIKKINISNILDEEDADMMIKEADLGDHLENQQQNANSEDKQTSVINGQSLLKTDYQLYEALNILKALSILK